MKLHLGHIDDAGLATYTLQLGWLPCGSALPPGEHQSLGLEDQGQKLAAEISPKQGLCLHWGVGTSHHPATETAVQALASFCLMKAHPSYEKCFVQ